MQAVGDVLRQLVAEIGEAAPAPESAAPVETAAPAPTFVGADERKRMVEALLAKARSGDLRSNPSV
jgi:hypothetical protein